MPPPNLDERELVGAIARRGPDAEAAMRQLFLAYREQLVRWCISHFGLTREDAEDDVQETFKRLYLHAHSFRGEAKVSSWLYAVARNLSLERLRRQRPEFTFSEDVWASELEKYAAPNIESQFCEYSAEEALQQCYDDGFAEFQKLHPKAAEAVTLAEHHNWSTEQLAEYLGRAKGATREYLSQCRKKLKPFLEKCRQYLKELP